MKSGGVDVLRSDCRKASALELCIEAEEQTAWRADGVAGEKAAKIEDLERVVEVFAVGLDSGGESLGMVESCSCGCVEEKSWKDAAAIEIKTAQDSWTVLGENGGWIPLELEGEAGIKLDACCDP